MWPYDEALTTTYIQILHWFQHTLFLWTGPTAADPGLDEPVDPIQEIDMCNVTNLNESNVTITFDAWRPYMLKFGHYGILIRPVK